MSKWRWKWIGYHVYSNLLTLLVVFGVSAVFFTAGNLRVTELGTFLKLAALSSAGAVMLGVVCGFNFSRNLRNRLEEITIGVRKLAYGDLQHRLPFTQDKEIGDIASAFNEMARRLEEQVTMLQRLADENERLIQQARSTAVNEERHRLARELHDAVSQQLFAISMTAASLNRVIERNPDKVPMLVSNIEHSATTAQAEMRALLLQLRPAELRNQNLTEAIESLATELRKKQVIDCELKLVAIDLPRNIENQLYRIVQEGISNVLRHAQASRLTLRLSSNPKHSRLTLIIEDNGQGFTENTQSQVSYGIQSIRERVALLGGTADWISYPDRGTRLEVRVPVVS